MQCMQCKLTLGPGWAAWAGRIPPAAWCRSPHRGPRRSWPAPSASERPCCGWLWARDRVGQEQSGSKKKMMNLAFFNCSLALSFVRMHLLLSGNKFYCRHLGCSLQLLSITTLNHHQWSIIPASHQCPANPARRWRRGSEEGDHSDLAPHLDQDRPRSTAEREKGPLFVWVGAFLSEEDDQIDPTS